ncbi:hypothetical protein DVA67_003180 [Solirubrobacter sp. CPCC 204708]|uniref:ABC transporter permease n=1 Tax=Solirubrobacter deserti TaxID=2282478 RepID=A0ABT4RV60_9ACTN|nr:hypothetical protein [Solirubrobacter deserti]MBE2314961.1 hypothetical protein [Solirubrobacter deserti]MDA0142467.1 hypothetical protein [Solirubrobacter deserti]
MGELFARTCAAEWTRLWSVRSTWWFLAAAWAMMHGIALMAGVSTAGQPDPPVGDPAWGIAPIVVLPAQFALLAVAVTAVTAEYATGGIVPTLQWTPRRSVLFWARVVVTTAVATVLGVAFAFTCGLVGWVAARPILDLEGAGVLGTVAFVLLAGTLLSVGLGFLLRSTAGGLVGVFLLLLVLPALLPQFGYEWLTEIADVLPGTSAIFLLTEEPSGRGLTERGSVVLMLVWAVGALAGGWARLVRDDAG